MHRMAESIMWYFFLSGVYLSKSKNFGVKLTSTGIEVTLTNWKLLLHISPGINFLLKIEHMFAIMKFQMKGASIC